MSISLAFAPGLRLAVDDDPAANDIRALARELEAENVSKLAATCERWWRLGVYVRDNNKIVAGLAARTYRQWLFVDHLWVREDLRRLGIGRELIARAERRAIERGCHSAWLDTHSIRARDLYVKLGYELATTVECPLDHRRYFMRKQIASVRTTSP